MVIKVMGGGYPKRADVNNLIQYVLNDEREGILYRGYVAMPSNLNIVGVQNDIWENKKHFAKTTGRNMRHMIISLEKKEMEYIKPFDLHCLGYWIAQNIYNEYKMVFSVHADTDNLHLHVAIDTVSFKTGLKFQESPQEHFYRKKLIMQELSQHMPSSTYYVCDNNVLDGTRFCPKDQINMEEFLKET